MKPNRDAILLSDVQVLTLRGNGALTTHRRVPAAPQLKCVSASAICALHEIDTMRCTNQGAGYDSEDIQWSCTASLPAELKLGSTDVICEGYSRADDPYVLKGSCGVEYRLALTKHGEERYPDLGGGGFLGKDGSDPSAWLFGILFVAVALWIIYSACTAPRPNGGHRVAGGRRPPRGGGGGGGGGWGPGGGGGGGGDGDAWDDPPPPYPGSNNSKTSRTGQQQGGAGGWRPGFWSGLLGGAAAGYAAGNRGNRNNNNTGGWGGYNRDYGTNYGGGWGGSSTSSSRSNSGSSSQASGPRHESTGFGGTSRR
ncbi:uncharacterized protein B0I36DRAFT_70244 [Microdochium trichocladiopsis]|uniref:Store-operated calcium entry-associated regulatory factor n=1 Tax=Microdochium trichocladiopsis TaxID=1682393 RepID=A0A9P8YE11_9PEZI|nr:uncharacterized protein B0I36DRAFT_70244 [Microdochium trichocladiopsis]KAH7037730.1 hypothetical protein B0I36DRAFT_70244 [Microdochium trichocladiopsis]